jgi:exosome complex exonuclease DIS3/RRP44
VKQQLEAKLDGAEEACYLFAPSDRRFPYAFVRSTEELEDKSDAQLLDTRFTVSLNVWDRFNETPTARLNKTLGQSGDIEVETAMILLEHEVDDSPFSDEVLACLPPADCLSNLEEEAKVREDFRDICVCSIDPPGCEDIDDALSCETLDNGNLRVGVHIADVTHYVKPNTAIDLEASKRCTSVYLRNRRIDMLPRLLTTNICSLRDDGDRLTFSAIWEMTPDAKIVSERFTKGIIRSWGALSYQEAQERLDADPAEDNSVMSVAIRQLNKLAVQLRERRRQLGALELASQEMKFEIDAESDMPTNVFKYEQGATNFLIEEFMLLANQGVARKISEFTEFSVLRHHVEPKEDKMGVLAEQLRSGWDVDFKWNTNKELQETLDTIKKPGDVFFNKLVRMMTCRCMEEAQYIYSSSTPEEAWYHYGLAMTHYTHFTSPIRRYADVMVHRALEAAIAKDVEQAREDFEVFYEPVVAEQTDRLNAKNRNARNADRASTEFHIYLFFKANGAQVSEGVVTEVVKDGLRVVVEEYGCEGFVDLPENDWVFFQDLQKVSGRPLSKFEGVEVGLFDRVVVKIEADPDDARQRALKFTLKGFPKGVRGKEAPSEAATQSPKEAAPEEKQALRKEGSSLML